MRFFFSKRHVNMKQNEKGKTHQTARKHATKRATKMLKNSGKNPTNEQSEKQHFTKHASFCFASFRYSRIFLVFFFSKFSAILWETSVQKVRNKHNAPKKTKKREHVCKVHDFAHLLSLKNSFRARHPSKAAS